jgi:pimeloyl-ACP methyl ester carboxylesterase
LAGLRLLKSCEFVDPARVVVFANSMGPVVGSLAFAQEPVRGLIAVETVGTSWFEYDLERLRVQAGVSGKTPEEVDREVREYEPCSHRFFIEKEKPDTLTRTQACKDFLQPFGAVPYSYMQAVADISLGKQWRNADFPVLVIYRLASPVTTAHQNRYLADLINSMNPGRATYREVQEMSHDLHHWASPQEYMMNRCGANACHPFQEGLFEVMMPWLEKLV